MSAIVMEGLEGAVVYGLRIKFRITANKAIPYYEESDR